MRVIATQITAAEFAPFGQVVIAPEEYGRRSYADGLSHDGRPARLSTTHAAAVPLPLRVDFLERHPSSSQTFVPLRVERWVVVVSASLEPSDVRAFVVGPGTAVTIGRSVWHYQLSVVDSDAEFAVLMWADGSTDDEVAEIAPFEVVVDPGCSVD